MLNSPGSALATTTTSIAGVTGLAAAGALAGTSPTTFRPGYLWWKSSVTPGFPVQLVGLRVEVVAGGFDVT